MSVAISIDDIWLQRWNQNILAAQRGIAEIKLEKSWGELNPAELRYIKTEDYDLYLEMLLLKSSLLRAAKKMQKSSSLIASTYKKHKSLKKKMNFKMQFELGLDHWCHEDIPSALDSFLLAEKLASKSYEKIYSSFNLLLCLEALDLDRLHIEEKLNSELSQLASHEHIHIRQQYDAYILRKSFYQNGEIHWQSNQKEIGQADFFACFVSHLPYMATSAISSYQNLLSNHDNLWQGSYRLRTINGFFIPADTTTDRLGDGIDRLYLWSWYWMADQKEMSIKKLELTLNSIIKVLDLEELSVENKLLLRNALFWIRIFSPKSTSQVKDLIRDLQKINGKSYHILEQEFILQQEIWSLISCGKSSGNKITGPFKHILDELKSDDTKILPNLAQTIQTKVIKANSKADIFINMATNEIQNLLENSQQCSPLLARLFFLIHKRGRFSVNDIQEGFGTNKRQIYNLFNRAKKFYSDLDLVLKDDTIISSIDREKIQIENSYAESKVSKKLIKTESYKPSKAESVVSINAIKLLHPEDFNRKQFQEIFSFSKATATRILNDWLEQEIIEKKGTGRSVRYLWKK